MQKNQCDWFCDRLDAFLLEEVSEIDHQKFTKHLESCPSCQIEFQLAHKIQESFLETPPIVCPNEVYTTAMKSVRREARKESLEALKNKVAGLWSPIWKPALALAILAIVTFGIIWMNPPQTEVEEQFTTTEIEQAVNEAKWAFAYLSKVNEKAVQEVVHDKVIVEKVATPVNEAINNSLDFRNK